MTEAHLYPELIPWKPTPAEVPYAWLQLVEEFAQKARGSPHEYILKVKYDAQGTGDLLRTWGVPWQVVVAGYLWEYDKQEIKRAGLSDADRVISHINESTLYAGYIEDENLPPLLTPPYKDLGGLLLVIAIYYQALKALQRQSEGKTLPGKALLSIESIGRTLRNIATRLGMWHVKREVEDLTEQLRNPQRFAEAQQEHKCLLEQDVSMLEETQQLLMEAYQDATQRKIYITYTPCGIVGMKRRLQDAHTTVTLPKTELTGFDLVTFDVIVPTVQECYMAQGVLTQLGTIQDRITDLIANPKPSGCSWLAFGLELKHRNYFTQKLCWPDQLTRICQLLITTPLMHAITWFGCLHPECYQIYIEKYSPGQTTILELAALWQGEEGRSLLAIKEEILANQDHTLPPNSIVVYDKNHRPVALPKGATALDFAFALDSNIAKHAVEVLINNRKAPLHRILDAGDVVEIITSTEVEIPYKQYRDYATTPMAHRQINEAEQQIHRGHELLSKELKRSSYKLTKQDVDSALRWLVLQHNLGTPQSYLNRLDKEGKPPYTPVWAAGTIIEHMREQNACSSADMPHSWEEKGRVLPLRPHTLMNPFDISRPATAKMFFGRSVEIATMRRELCDGQQGRAFILYGPRRSGKTSICKNFLERQVQPPYWYALFSLQNYAHHTEGQILEQLAEQVRCQFIEQLHQQVPGWEDYPGSDPQIRFKHMLQRCIAQIPDTRLILALDEFGGVLEAYDQGFLERRFFTYWKDLLTEIPQISLILSLPTSSHDQLTSTKFVNAFSFAGTLPMLFLDIESAKQLLVDPLREQAIEIQPQTVALATKLTGGNPYYLTLIGRQLILYLNHQVDQQIVTDRHLHLAVEQIIESNAPQNFDFLKRELQNREEYIILDAIVELTRHTRQPKVQIKTIAESLHLPIGSIRRHLDRLRAGLILEEMDSGANPFYSFKIEIVRRWLARNRWLLAEEIDEEYRQRGPQTTA